jgi:hypothetical protein
MCILHPVETELHAYESARLNVTPNNQTTWLELAKGLDFSSTESHLGLARDYFLKSAPRIPTDSALSVTQLGKRGW